MTIDLELVKNKLYEKLRPSGWADVLKTFFFSREMDILLQALQQENERHHRFTPPLKDVFQAFERCPWKKLEVIWVGPGPYPNLGVADGMAFSCSHSEKPERALSYMHKAIKETVYPHLTDEQYHPPLDLTPWASQGVLLLNTALTTQVGTSDMHQAIWNDFTRFTLSQISERNWAGLIFVFLGNKSAEWAPLIGENHFTYCIPHPTSGRYTKEGKWQSNNIFNEINRIRALCGGNSIQW